MPLTEKVPLHRIESIVTPDRFEVGVHRMRVAGGWIYWLQPMGGAYVSEFVPDEPVELVRPTLEDDWVREAMRKWSSGAFGAPAISAVDSAKDEPASVGPAGAEIRGAAGGQDPQAPSDANAPEPGVARQEGGQGAEQPAA